MTTAVSGFSFATTPHPAPEAAPPRASAPATFDETAPTTLPRVGTTLPIYALDVGGAAIDVADALLASLPAGNTLAAAIVAGPQAPVAEGGVQRVFLPRNPNTLRLLVDYYNDDRSLPEGLSRATVSLLRKEARHFALEDLYTECKVLYPLRRRAWAAKAVGAVPARAAALQTLATALRAHGRTAQAARKQLRAARLLNELTRAPETGAPPQENGAPTSTSPRPAPSRPSDAIGPRPAPRRQHALRGVHATSTPSAPRHPTKSADAGVGFTAAVGGPYGCLAYAVPAPAVSAAVRAAPGATSSSWSSAILPRGGNEPAATAGPAPRSIPGIARKAPAETPWRLLARGQPAAEEYGFAASWPPPSPNHAPLRREGAKLFEAAVRQNGPSVQAVEHDAGNAHGGLPHAGSFGVVLPAGPAGSQPFGTLSFDSGSTPEKAQLASLPWTPPDPASAVGDDAFSAPWPAPCAPAPDHGAPLAPLGGQVTSWAPQPTASFVYPEAEPQPRTAVAFGPSSTPWSLDREAPQSPSTFARVSAWSTTVADCFEPSGHRALAAAPAPTFGYEPAYLYPPPA